MAYCNKCGAYIPDGQTVCLACGYDEQAEKKAHEAEAAQAARSESTETRDTGNYYSFTNEELRQKLDEQRKKQQEQSRKWAEQEKQRCRSQTKNDAGFSFTPDSHNNVNRSAPEENGRTKAFSVLSYISFLFVLPMIFSPNDGKAMFHAKQGLRLFIYSVISDSLSKIPVLGLILQAGRIYLLVKGIINASNDRQEPLPYIGTLGEKK